MRSLSYSSVFLGFMIAGMGMLAPMAIIVELFCMPMSLQVVTWLPMTAASFPSIFTLLLVPPVTFPSFLGLFWNLIVPGSCMCILSSCFATLSFTAHFLSFIVTSFASLSFSFPMKGCGSGTVVVVLPAGTTIIWVSIPITLSPSTAICLPSAVTPLEPLIFIFLPFTLISLSLVIVVFFLVFMDMASSDVSFVPFSDTKSRFSPL